MPLYPGKPIRVEYEAAAAISADTWVILIDLSDTTNYKHPSATKSLNILALDVACEKASNGLFYIHVGVVLENDTTNGTVQWIKSWPLSADGNPTDSTDRFVDRIEFQWRGLDQQGIDTTVVSDVALYICGKASGVQTAIKSDAGDLNSAAGGSSLSPVAGDIVIFFELLSGSGNISNVSIGCEYTAN